MGLKKNMRIDSKYTIDALFLQLYKVDVIIDVFELVIDSECLINEKEESESIKVKQMLLPFGDKNITHILGLVTSKLL